MSVEIEMCPKNPLTKSFEICARWLIPHFKIPWWPAFGLGLGYTGLRHFKTKKHACCKAAVKTVLAAEAATNLKPIQVLVFPTLTSRFEQCEVKSYPGPLVDSEGVWGTWVVEKEGGWVHSCANVHQRNLLPSLQGTLDLKRKDRNIDQFTHCTMTL